ncbi:MAG: methyltransferase [Hydrogenobacter sp.]
MKYLKDLEVKEFTFFGGKVKFKQPKKHRLSVTEILFLSNVKGIGRKSKVVDLGAGFGTLSILASLKYGCEVWAVERDESMLELLLYNVRINDLTDKVHVVEGDIRFVDKFMQKNHFDNVLLNPPFYPRTYGCKNNTFHFEGDTQLTDFLKATKYLLKDGGKVNLLYTAFRWVEAILTLKNNNINPITLRIFYPKMKKDGKFLHIYGVKNSKGYATIEKPLIINRDDGEYTDEVKDILCKFL